MRLRILLSILCFILQSSSVFVQAQSAPSSIDRDRARAMLSSVRNDLEKHYYDPTFRGIDLEEKFKKADDRLREAASLAQLFGIIGQTLIDFDDSHTFFVPPGRPYRTEYGWQMQMIGDHCFVSAIKPRSDAEAKGLRQGDEVDSIDGFVPMRKNMWKLKYLYHAIKPRPGMRLEVVKPDGNRVQLDIKAKIREQKRIIDLTGSDIFDLIRESENEDRLNRQRFVEMEDLLIWKMPSFDLERTKVDDLMNKVRKRKGLILDLRGNDGGYEETLLRLIGNFFDHDIKVGDLKRRKEIKPLIAKTRGKDIFTGSVVVLIDSESGSAAELFARVIQLEKRGRIIGDRSAGAVMRSKLYPHQLGVETIVPFSVSITDADIIMADGKSLEHVGVQPDELKLPTGSDLAAKRDPVLAYAASLLGVNIDDVRAGSFFPIEWLPN